MIPPTFVFYMAVILGAENSVMFSEDPVSFFMRSFPPAPATVSCRTLFSIGDAQCANSSVAICKIKSLFKEISYSTQRVYLLLFSMLENSQLYRSMLCATIEAARHRLSLCWRMKRLPVKAVSEHVKESTISGQHKSQLLVAVLTMCPRQSLNVRIHDSLRNRGLRLVDVMHIRHCSLDDFPFLLSSVSQRIEPVPEPLLERALKHSTCDC
jgi:hypothetical protein